MILDQPLKKFFVSKKGKDSNIKSFLKSVSWRIIGTIDTIVISYLVTGQLIMAVSIGSVEVLTKILLYYFHERVWDNFTKNGIDSNLKSITKSVSWRLVGTLDTMVISYFITGQLVLAVSIGSIEVISKIVLYYLHERVWENFTKSENHEPETELVRS